MYMLENSKVFRTNCPEYHPKATKLKKAEGERLYREQCRGNLLAMLKPGDTIYCTLRHVSRSGMQRRINLHAIVNGTMVYLSGFAAIVTGDKLHHSGGIVINGCGMDMGFHLVYSLGHYLWPNGTPEPHGRRNGEPDSDGGYALKHSWL